MRSGEAEEHSVKGWSIAIVSEWLEKRGFGNVVENFGKEEVDGGMLLKLTDKTMHGLGMGNDVQRLKLTCAIDKLANPKYVTNLLHHCARCFYARFCVGFPSIRF